MRVIGLHHDEEVVGSLHAFMHGEGGLYEALLARHQGCGTHNRMGRSTALQGLGHYEVVVAKFICDPQGSVADILKTEAVLYDFL